MRKFFVCILLIGLILGVYGYFSLKSRLDSTTLNSQNVLVEIPKGSSIAKVLSILQDKGIWQDETALKLYCKTEKCDLKAGAYEIAPNMALQELIELLSSGKTAVRKVTIPEGRATWEIPSYLRKAFPNIDSTRWEGLTHNPSFAKSLGVNANSLEGYLLPDTYPFPVNADEETIIRQMVQANLRLKSEMEAKQSPEWKKLGGWHQVLTLASVVEEETGMPEERPLIAGVFHNRLDIGMPLGADPTVRFIFRNLTGPIYKSQLNSDSPYNTRKFKGLMPGPVSNPGRKAIEAALFPTKTNMLFFVAKDDGSHTHFFSSNLSDHNKYKNIAAKNRGE